MNTSEKLTKYISLAFYGVFSMLTAFILILSVLRPLNYLLPWQMAIGTFLSVFLFAALGILWDRLYGKLTEKRGRKAVKTSFWILFFLFWAFLFTLSMLHGVKFLRGDYEILYLSAVEAAEKRDLTYRNYFLVYGNNTQPMLLLSAVIRICRLLKINEFPVLLLYSSALVAGSVLSVKYLLPGKNGEKWGIPVLCFFYACLPVYVFTPNFYTDTMSFGLGIIALAFLKAAFLKEQKKPVRVFLFMLSAFFTVLGSIWKITSLIPLIAAFLVFLFCRLFSLSKEERKKKLLGIAVYATWLLLFFAVFRIYFSGFEILKQSKEESNPTLSWVALGMREDGSYAKNVEFSDTLNAIQGREEKSRYVLSYMKEHKKEAFSLDHFLKKTRHNFAGGSFSASDFSARGERESVIYELMDPGGKYYWRTSQLTFCYIALVYAVYLYGSIQSLILLIKNKKIAFTKYTADLAFFGIFLFLTIWEANNRQLYNLLPVFITSLFCNLEIIVRSFRKGR